MDGVDRSGGGGGSSKADSASLGVMISFECVLFLVWELLALCDTASFSAWRGFL